MGYDVSIPLTESAAYDLVVDDGHRLARVQCKFGDRRHEVDLRRIHSNSTGYVVKRTAEGAYDWLFVLDGADVPPAAMAGGTNPCSSTHPCRDARRPVAYAPTPNSSAWPRVKIPAKPHARSADSASTASNSTLVVNCNQYDWSAELSTTGNTHSAANATAVDTVDQPTRPRRCA